MIGLRLEDSVTYNKMQIVTIVFVVGLISRKSRNVKNWRGSLWSCTCRLAWSLWLIWHTYMSQSGQCICIVPVLFLLRPFAGLQ